MSDLILLSIKFYGMAIVISFVVAVLIKGIVVALPLMRRSEATPAVRPATPPAAVPPEHVAAIAASVAAVMGPGHIIHIEDRGRSAVWTAEGRMIHQTSHATRKG
jgi:hypothetical protein